MLRLLVALGALVRGLVEWLAWRRAFQAGRDAERRRQEVAREAVIAERDRVAAAQAAERRRHDAERRRVDPDRVFGPRPAGGRGPAPLPPGARDGGGPGPRGS